jgi:osmotically-inducible protein OsmY
MKITRSVVIGAAAVAFTLALGVSQVRAEWHSDAWITTKAKMALLTTEDITSTAITSINVDTVDGRLTLHGKVATENEKQKAQNAVATIDGVKEVRNLLAVVPDAQQDRVEVGDDELKDRVKKALAGDKALADSKIEVQSVNSGVVLLAGDASSSNDHLRALQITRDVAGVRQVDSEINSPDEVADAEIRDDGGAADDTMIGDAWITSKVKMRLLANDVTPALDINVDTRDGIVTLFGIVPSDEAKSAAAAEAHKVESVKNVRNELQIVAKTEQDAVEVKDDELTRQVENAMEKRTALNDADIDVEVKNSVVRLTGTVPSQNHRLTAATTARSIDGVRSVQDDLRVVRSQGSD